MTRWQEPLTERQRQMIRQEYADLPRTERGAVQFGYRQELARKWNISVVHLVRIVKDVPAAENPSALIDLSGVIS